MTREKVEITETSPNKFQAKIGNWTSGTPRKLRTVERRVKAKLQELENEQKRIVEIKRYKNAPKKKCPRCKGNGSLDSFLHIARGICFNCGGSGKVEK
jgi:hypothetical protein